jgi:hypothetical protein
LLATHASEQINTIHRLQLAERWSIHKIEGHLHIGSSYYHEIATVKGYAARRMSLSLRTARGISSAEMLLKPSMNPWGDGRSKYDDDSGASQSFWRAARSAIS